ncbi:potassium transporter-domain-containing protein [Dactylonectria macrodidyma]|uniref:Potassium transporter-domain-containing protein n=1 Tax=Dactylonectria macrodidyma TaxID=307937 RepID=A0A9P9IHN5_9HYPO|nr:potassium transporter-domain-containing protein [Dactylonectria macrodidyma]
MSQGDAVEPANRVQFDDGIHPVQSIPRDNVVNRASNASLEDEEKANRIAEIDGNLKHKQNYSGLLLLWVAFQSTGIIYGDIGTSPLYVYSSTFTSQPSFDDLTGALSIIIWSLTLIVTIKYTFIVLRADDDGQGGTFALYSLLARYTNIVKGGPKADDTVKLERYLTNELKPGGKSLRKFLENSPAAQFSLKAIGVLGVSLVMADGILTPAQSVLGAIQGIKVADPTLTTPTIVGISCTILVLLFLLQPFGTSKLGTGFAPIVTIWLLFNMACGIYNLVIHDHKVLKAFSPHYAFDYLIRNGYEGWKSLGGLLLAFTGVEAMFADLGAFSKRAIQISWLFLAYPCLILAYAGQAAFISEDASETAITNPFFYTVPPGSFYFSLVLAVLAAIVASQAMITSTFQLLSQVYMPMANWLLMIGTVVVTAVYNNTTSLGHAYGVCVILVTFISTCMVSLVAILVWRVPSFVVIPIFLAFAALDGAFMSAVLTKVPDGAWFTLLLAFILSSIFILWRFGKEAQWSAESLDCLLPSDVLSGSESDGSSRTTRLTETFGSTPISTVPGLGVFFDKSGDPSVLPVSFAHFVLKFAARPAVLIFFHMRPLPIPFVEISDRFVVTRTSGIANCYNVVLRHGYADDVIRPGMARDLVGQVELAVSKVAAPDAAELKSLREAYSSQIVYVLGKETMKIKRDGRSKVWATTRWILLEIFLWIRENSRTKMADVNIDVDRLVEVGFLKEI